jgi:hypothetical protein
MKVELELRVRPVGEWFAECGNTNSNNALAEALSAQGYGYDSEMKCESVLCDDGKERPLFRIPGSFVRRMIKAKKGSDVLAFEFWHRAHGAVPAHKMSFLEQSTGAKRSVHFKSAADKLRAIRARKTPDVATGEPPF